MKKQNILSRIYVIFSLPKQTVNTLMMGKIVLEDMARFVFP